MSRWVITKNISSADPTGRAIGRNMFESGAIPLRSCTRSLMGNGYHLMRVATLIDTVAIIYIYISLWPLHDPETWLINIEDHLFFPLALLYLSLAKYKRYIMYTRYTSPFVGSLMPNVFCWIKTDIVMKRFLLSLIGAWMLRKMTCMYILYHGVA